MDALDDRARHLFFRGLTFQTMKEAVRWIDADMERQGLPLLDWNVELRYEIDPISGVKQPPK